MSQIHGFQFFQRKKNREFQFSEADSTHWCRKLSSGAVDGQYRAAETDPSGIHRKHRNLECANCSQKRGYCQILEILVSELKYEQLAQPKTKCFCHTNL